MQTNIELSEPETEGLQKALGSLSKREYLHRCAVWGIQHPDAIHNPEGAKELKISQQEQPNAQALSEPELPDVDLIERYENCLYRIKKNERWDSDMKEKDGRILRDIRKIWEMSKVSNAKFMSAIAKTETRLFIDQQAAATERRFSWIATARRLRDYMSDSDKKFLDELVGLLKHLEEVSESGELLSEQDLASIDRIAYLVPFYKTDITLAELEDEVMASFTDDPHDNDFLPISKKLERRSDLIFWVMKRMEATGKIKLQNPNFKYWYVKVK
jgi:hypothetical protein